jgi:ABC-type Fe3+-siderophore transport system permease subunit
MNRITEREILTNHLNRLDAGLGGLAAYPPMTPDQRRALEPLLGLAEWLYSILVPVEPSPAFVLKLSKELALAAADLLTPATAPTKDRGQLALIKRHRKPILFTAASLGSALSLIGLVLIYMFRQRDTVRSVTTT